MEAQLQGTAVPRTVTLDELKQISEKGEDLATARELAAMQIKPFDTTTSHAAFCAFQRAANAATERLPAVDVGSLARAEVQPK